MPGTPHQLALSANERPPCSHCGTPMWIVRIEPVGRNYNERTFECPKCEQTETIIVNKDPNNRIIQKSFEPQQRALRTYTWTLLRPLWRSLFARDSSKRRLDEPLDM
jgi:hypothetical protein